MEIPITNYTAVVYGIPGNIYTINEAMAPGSISTLPQYTVVTSALNSTPAGSIPPVGALPISFTPALGDDVTYTILNAAPHTFSKTVDKAHADIGDVLTYTVTVNNPNNFAVSNVLVTDIGGPCWHHLYRQSDCECTVHRHPTHSNPHRADSRRWR